MNNLRIYLENNILRSPQRKRGDCRQIFGTPTETNKQLSDKHTQSQPSSSLFDSQPSSSLFDSQKFRYFF